MTGRVERLPLGLDRGRVESDGPGQLGPGLPRPERRAGAGSDRGRQRPARSPGLTRTDRAGAGGWGMNGPERCPGRQKGGRAGTRGRDLGQNEPARRRRIFPGGSRGPTIPPSRSRQAPSRFLGAGSREAESEDGQALGA